MPTFDEDVTVNGQITINKRGDGAVLLNLASERNWEFRQSGSGSSTALELASVGGGGNKSLIINNPGRVDVGRLIRAAKRGIASIDLNPVMVGSVGEGAIVVDGLVERG